MSYDLHSINGLHKAAIGAALKMRGTNLRRLGVENGFAASTLRASLHKPHPRAHKLIAETIGKPLHEIWPDWYGADGSRIKNNPSLKKKKPQPNAALRSGPSAIPSQS